MNKQQQIKEIANIPHKCIKSGCEGCIKNDRKCAYYKQAEALYDAGYRKADEVRKETAEKILEKIRNSFWMNRNNRYALNLWLKEQFGVEIKE